MYFLKLCFQPLTLLFPWKFIPHLIITAVSTNKQTKNWHECSFQVFDVGSSAAYSSQSLKSVQPSNLIMSSVTLSIQLCESIYGRKEIRVKPLSWLFSPFHFSWCPLSNTWWSIFWIRSSLFVCFFVLIFKNTDLLKWFDSFLKCFVSAFEWKLKLCEAQRERKRKKQS